MPKHWAVSAHARIHGRNVCHGTEVSIRGERGRFRFLRHVTNGRTGTEWIDVYGGVKGHETIRSFRPERVRTVHVKRAMRAASGRQAAAA